MPYLDTYVIYSPCSRDSDEVDHTRSEATYCPSGSTYFDHTVLEIPTLIFRFEDESNQFEISIDGHDLEVFFEAVRRWEQSYREENLCQNELTM